MLSFVKPVARNDMRLITASTTDLFTPQSPCPASHMYTTDIFRAGQRIHIGSTATKHNTIFSKSTPKSRTTRPQTQFVKVINKYWAAGERRE